MTCQWCGKRHPVKQLCHTGQLGLSRRSFFVLTSMAAIGTVVDWTPMPRKLATVPGSLLVHVEVDITRFTAAIEALDRQMLALANMGQLTKDTFCGVINLHVESTQKEKGFGLELSCDVEWHGRDPRLPVLQHPDGSSLIIKT